MPQGAVIIGAGYLEGNKCSEHHLQWGIPSNCPFASFGGLGDLAGWAEGGSLHWRSVAVGSLNPVPCPFGGRMASWLPGKWLHDGLFPPVLDISLM